MKIGVLNPINFYWKDPDIQTRMESTRLENERLRQAHPFATISYSIKNFCGGILKEIALKDFGYSITEELGKIYYNE